MCYFRVLHGGGTTPFRERAAQTKGNAYALRGVMCFFSLVDKVHGVVGSSVMKLGSSIVSPLVGVHWNPYLPASAPNVADQPPISVSLVVVALTVALN